MADTETDLHDFARGDARTRCYCPRHEIMIRDAPRRKRRTKNQMQHCPSCHCPLEPTRLSPARGSHDIEATLDSFEHYQHPMISTIRQPHINPLSPRSGIRCREGSNCRRHSHKSSSKPRRNEQDEQLVMMIKDIVDCGLATENTREYELSDPDTDYKDKPFANLVRDLHPKKTHVSEIGRSHRKIDKPEENEILIDERRKKMSNIRFHNSMPPDQRQFCPTKSKNVEEQPRNRVPLKLNTGCGHQCITTDDTDFEQISHLVKDERLKKEMGTIPCLQHSMPCLQQSTLQESNYKYGKEEDDTNKSREKEKDEEENYSDHDVKLHIARHQALNLIDDARINGPGVSADEKKNDATKTHKLLQEVSCESMRNFQGEYHKILTSLNYDPLDCDRELMKTMRMECLNNIQDECKKLYYLEKLCNNCSSRQSLPILHSRGSNMEQHNEQWEQKQHTSQEQQQQQQQSATTVS